jgi:hypothetical protein
VAPVSWTYSLTLTRSPSPRYQRASHHIKTGSYCQAARPTKIQRRGVSCEVSSGKVRLTRWCGALLKVLIEEERRDDGGGGWDRRSLASVRGIIVPRRRLASCRAPNEGAVIAAGGMNAEKWVHAVTHQIATSRQKE